MRALPVALASLSGPLGALLLVDAVRHRTRSLDDRLRPHVAAEALPRRQQRTDGIVRAVAALSAELAVRLALVLGSREDLQLRLERVHHPDDATTFRMRQGAGTLTGLAVAVALAALARPALPLTLAALLLGPALGFVVPEQVLADRIARRRRRATLEVPLVAEQMAMLLGAGMSLGATLGRIGDRSTGVVGEDLRRVMRRVRQGVRERDALDEWAASADVPAITRLVAVLRLHGEATDLGRLVTEEARSARDEAHRSLLALVERKDQQVWVPVTVAALLPGCIFLAVPFAEALRPFTG